jgi:hypothetical protein
MMNSFHFYHSEISGFTLGEGSKPHTRQFILCLIRLKTEAYRTHPNHLPLQQEVPQSQKLQTE